MISQALKDRIPPHNDDSEKATLGALLLDSEALSTVLRYLRPEDFYKKAHVKLFQGIISLFDKGEAIDLLTLSQELRALGDLEACGGVGYISDLTTSVPTSANVEYYARVVQGNSIRRNLLKISNEIIADAYDDAVDSRIIIEEAERKIFEITDNQQIGAFKGVKEILPRTIEAIEKLYHNKDGYTGIPSGFPVLDQLTSGFQKSEFIVIGARPSIGKTAFALSMAANIAIKSKIAAGFFTLEMSDMALMQRVVSSEARLNSSLLRSGLLKPSDFHKLTEAAGRIYDAPLYIDDTPNIKLLDLRAQARRMKSKHDIQILFIDYIGLVGAENREIPRHEQIAEISRSLKSLARELDVPVITLSQVGRQTEGKPPSLADLRESGSIEQDADVVIFLHRDRGTEGGHKKEQSQDLYTTQVVLAKQRNGPVGTLEVAFLPKYTKFESLSPDTP